MFFLIFILMVAVVWLLWTISRNTGDALDKQTAIQYELVSLEKKLEQLSEKMSAPAETEKGVAETKKSEAPAPRNKELSALVDINQATLKEIVRLPRIGNALGQRIIDGRPYASIDELQGVQGISKDMFNEIKPLVTIS